MLKRLTAFADRYATGRHILYGFLASLVFGIAPLSWAITRIRAHSPDAGPLDMKNTYTPDEAYAMIAKYGDDVRTFYIINAFTLDTLAPFLFNLTFLFIILVLLRKHFGPESRYRAAAVLVFLVAYGSDLIENVLLSIIVGKYPERLDSLVQVACVVTVIKRVTIYMLWAAAALLGLGALARRALRRA
ncbi:MAG: hypothetical protein U0441_06505 [Polyangiaceae bacterium]